MSMWPPASAAPERLTLLPSWAMARLSRVARSWLEQNLAQLGLVLGEYATLETVSAHTDASQRELALAAGYDPSDLVTILDRLEAASLITRTRDARDRRRQVVALTADGRTALRRGRAAAQAARRRLLEPLAADQASEFEATLRQLLFHHCPDV
ncbi:MAG: MarR family winged helix-turn-helix transcriptional regulator [Jatrophihabitans sp.]|uniref:MarR family winged helix-turn-helix transcriptional regulator n=1 Tax=Jatrophihabitans sp. TaxID=1932789 RepID=UPI003F7D23A0